MFTPVELDKIRNFRYGMKPISLIEGKFGKKLAEIDMENLSMEETAVLIWAGLVHEDKDLTPDKVMDLVDEHSSLPKVLEKMTKAMESAFGEVEASKNLQKVASK